jgi:hypothetical protein
MGLRHSDDKLKDIYETIKLLKYQYIELNSFLTWLPTIFTVGKLVDKKLSERIREQGIESKYTFRVSWGTIQKTEIMMKVGRLIS